MTAEQMISSAEMERVMKVQEVILKAMAGSLKWWEAAEIIWSDGLDDEAVAGTWILRALQISKILDGRT